jgi:anti-sigma regulatory factor (Ser/Thr protein kinase)
LVATAAESLASRSRRERGGSNTIEHAYTAADPANLVTMSFWTDPHHLYFEVADHGRWRQPGTDPATAAAGS